MLRFDGKVVLITGAGNGLGKEYALAFGARGATVVVNDLGGSSSGEGSSKQPVDVVVEQIVKAGGKAVANYDSVEEGVKIVRDIIDKCGRIDVIVHNAGILRDKSLGKMKDVDWDLVQRIHLRSVFLLTRAAWPHMCKNKFGRIITVASSAGIYGNFGQCNYSAAKMGVHAFSQCVALEGKKYNIQCNCVAPIAGSRLTRFVMPDDMADALKAKYVSPLMLWLCHGDCSDSGGLYECGAGWMGKLRWERTDGCVVRKKTEDVSPEDVRANWAKICDFSKTHHPININDANSRYFNTLLRFEKSNGTQVEDVFNYCQKDLILYALGVGVRTKEEGSLRYLYEDNNPFHSLPTYSVIPAYCVLPQVMQAVQINGKEVDWSRLLHGEQYTHVYKQLPVGGRLKVRGEMVVVLDKGTGAVVVVNAEIYNENDEMLALNQFSLFLRGEGGFGGPKGSEKMVSIQAVPSRSPDVVVKEKTFEDQATLYRLSGDTNPLHIDPSVASMAGFKTPILHGLCTYGIACRHVINSFCPTNPSNVKAIKARFSSEVTPGDTIQTEMWKEAKRIHFQCKVMETGKVCLSGGYVDLEAEEVKSKL